ncbi:putative AC transposase [Ilyonectria robusta]
MQRALDLQLYIEELVGEAASQFATERSHSQHQRGPLVGLYLSGKKPLCLDDENLLDKDDWNAIQWVYDILRHFKKQVKKLEGDNQLRVRRGVLHPGLGLGYLLGALKDQPTQGLSPSEARAAKKRGNKWAAKVEKMVRDLWI